MKKMTSILYLLVTVLAVSGCRVAALTAAGAYAYNKGDENKANFAKVNEDRQAHGLPPLTWDEYMHPDKNATPPANGTANSTTTSK